MNKIIDGLNKAMFDKLKAPKPEGATTIYRVKWCMRSDTFDGSISRISSSVTPRALERTKSFVSKDKAQNLLEELQAAFKVLDYGMEGLAYIEEDWFE